MNKLFHAMTHDGSDQPSVKYLRSSNRNEPAVKDSTKIIIRDLQVDMKIGIHDHEKQNEQKVIINIEAFAENNPHWQEDNYDHAICYETIVNAVQDMASQGHINLVETLAEQIAAFCLKDQRITSTMVRIEKPDIIGNTASVGVEITRSQ